MQSQEIQSIFWKVSACFCFVGINALIKALQLPMLQIIGLEHAFGAFFLWPWLPKVPTALFKNLLCWGRALVSFLGVILWVYALKKLSLFQSVALGFLGPVSTAFGAWFFLGENVTKKRIWAIGLGIIGGIFMSHSPGGNKTTIGPHTTTTLLYVFPFLAPLMATLFFSTTNLMSKALLSRIHPLVSTFILLCMLGILGLLASYSTFIIPSWAQWQLIIGLGGLSAIAHLCLNQAMHRADVMFLIPIGAIRLIASAFMGWCFFGEVLTPMLGVGAIFLLSALLLLIQEGRKKQSSLVQID
jgi:drug/metabolite transporter (DMT)-like permease